MEYGILKLGVIKVKLLLIEDEADIRNALHKGLAKCGYLVDEAEDGEAGLLLYEVNQYDLVILDLNLPTMDGLKVLAEIRKKDVETKVLILSARWEIDHKVEGLDLGANDYMVKPFHFAELEARIRALLRRQFVQGSAILTYGPLQMDTATKAVQVAGEGLELTGKEYAILNYLLLNQGRVVSAETLIEHLWDSDADLFSNAIKVHISMLRKKIGAYWDQELIRNIRGMGYILGEVSYEAVDQ